MIMPIWCLAWPRLSLCQSLLHWITAEVGERSEEEMARLSSILSRTLATSPFAPLHHPNRLASRRQTVERAHSKSAILSRGEPFHWSVACVIYLARESGEREREQRERAEKEEGSLSLFGPRTRALPKGENSPRAKGLFRAHCGGDK